MSALVVSPSLVMLVTAMLLGALSAGAGMLEGHARFEHYARRAELRKRMRALGSVGPGQEVDAPAMPLSIRILLALVRISHEKPFAQVVDWTSDVLPNKERDPLSPGCLEQADLTAVLSANDIARASITSMLMGAVLGLIFLFSILSLFAGIVGFVAGAYFGASFPRRTVARAAKERVDRCVAQLPHMIEVISLGSTAGSSFVSSLDLYCARFEGPLPQEMRRVAAAWKTGAQSWEQALADLAGRLDATPVTHFVSTVSQALKLGAPMAQMLEAQSVEARRSKRAQIEERIEKAPVKMLLPMGTLVLPAMLLLILGPVILGMSSGG